MGQRSTIFLPFWKSQNPKGQSLRLTAAYEKQPIKFQVAPMHGFSSPCMADDRLCALLINIQKKGGKK
jgi:hypothetical protein